MDKRLRKAIDKQLDVHREMLARSPGFQCCCCGENKSKADAASVEAYKPRNGFMSALVPGRNFATYVICKACAGLPESESFPRIEARLIKEGILRPEAPPPAGRKV